MELKSINHNDIFESQEESVFSAKIKKVQFLGDTAIIIIDKVLVKKLAIDNQTYLKEEITQDGNIMLRIEPLR